MDRRKFLKTTGTFVAGATVARSALAHAATEPTAAQGRLVLPLNRSWRYSRTVVAGAHARDFDDSGYERVVIPHTNVRLPWHGFDEKSYEFVSSYRRRFKLPPEARGHRVFVDFEGAMTASTVVMSFEAPTWRRVRELRPEVATCALYSARTLARTSLSAELDTLRAAGVRFIGVEHTVVDAAAVKQAQGAGIGLGAWTVNAPADMKRMIEAGVTILITDQPDMAKTLLNR